MDNQLDTEMDRRVYEVEVADMSLKLRSSHDEATVRELITIVDTRVREALSLGKNISFQNALLLASLHIAEELLMAKRTALAELGRMEVQAQGILSDLESSPLSRIRFDN